MISNLQYNQIEEFDNNDTKEAVRITFRRMIRRCESFRDKQLLTLRYIFKLKYSEIAVYLDKPIGTIKPQLLKAKNELINKKKHVLRKSVKLRYSKEYFKEYLKDTKKAYYQSIYGVDYEKYYNKYLEISGLKIFA